MGENGGAFLVLEVIFHGWGMKKKGPFTSVALLLILWLYVTKRNSDGASGM